MQFSSLTRGRGTLLDRMVTLKRHRAAIQEEMNDIEREWAQHVEHVRTGIDAIGSAVENFVFVTCNGEYDTTVLMQYRCLEDEIVSLKFREREHPPILITAQTVRFEFRGKSVKLRRVHLAAVTGQRPSYDLGRELVEIPVEPYYYVRSETLSTVDGIVRNHEGIVDSRQLLLGPIRSEITVEPVSYAKNKECLIPEGTSFDYGTLPLQSSQFNNAGVGTAYIQECLCRWTKRKTEHFRRT